LGNACASLMPPQNVSRRSRSAAARKSGAQNANEAGTAPRRQGAHAKRLSLPATKADSPERLLRLLFGFLSSCSGFSVLVRNGGSHAGIGAIAHRRVDRRAQARSAQAAAATGATGRSPHQIHVSQTGAAATKTAEGFQTLTRSVECCSGTRSGPQRPIIGCIKAAASPRRSLRSARTGLRLVHRRFRHARSQKDQGAAR
jgi:hypothetical protein